VKGQSQRQEPVPIIAALSAAALFYSTPLWSGTLDRFDWSGNNCHYFDSVRVSLARHQSDRDYWLDSRHVR
jgi:hypothetical protein